VYVRTDSAKSEPSCSRVQSRLEVSGDLQEARELSHFASVSFSRVRLTSCYNRRPLEQGHLLTDYIPAVVAAQRGEREAFGELYARFGRFVHAILLARVPPDEAGDLAQDVFLHAWTMIGSLREPAAFGGWISAIARRRAIDFLRRHPMEVELDDRAQNGPSPDTQAQAAEALAAIRTLPEAYRETLLLRLVEGCSGREIAALCGLTEDSVRVNLHRGFKLLRERLTVPGLHHER
jgi:RNA polymerase sigma-70 factor (ECF subfamily)